jgi:hypothetical protein
MKSAVASWGPAAWTYLHTVSMTWPDHPSDEDRITMARFLYAFTDVIPCHSCRVDFRSVLLRHLGPTPAAAATSVHLRDRRSLSRFIVDAHNYVNVKLDKPTVSYAQAVRAYLERSTSEAGHWRVALALLSVAALYTLVRVASARRRHG